MADPDDPDVTTTKGPPGPDAHAGPAPEPIDPETGQHGSYWVLTEEERAKGFVRPVRTKYLHRTCGGLTRMGNAIAETYARDPTFYGSTFCVVCKEHYPVSQFVWDGTQGIAVPGGPIVVGGDTVGS